MSERSHYWPLVVVALLLLGLLIVVPMFGMFMWAPMMMGGGMMGGWNHGFGWGYPGGIGWGAMIVGMLLPLLFIILLIVGAYLLLTNRRTSVETDAALKILNERYAKGEISTQQYAEMKEQLSRK